MNNLQTPEILKKARENLGLSQTSVSRETGLNRTYLSRFESGVQILPDDNLQALQDHYATMGFDFSEVAEEEPNQHGNPTVAREGVTIMDGFLIPDEIDPITVEELLSELKQHEDFIESELSAIPKSGLFGTDETNLRRRLRLIGLRGLRCYSIVQALKGRENVFSNLTDSFDIDMSVTRKNLQAYLLEGEQA
jgi:transcriptional regulator with XRE-family HTH domain